MASDDLTGPDDVLAWSTAGIMLALSGADCEDARQDLADLVVNALGSERGVRVLDRAWDMYCSERAGQTFEEATDGK